MAVYLGSLVAALLGQAKAGQVEEKIKKALDCSDRERTL